MMVALILIEDFGFFDPPDRLFPRDQVGDEMDGDKNRPDRFDESPMTEMIVPGHPPQRVPRFANGGEDDERREVVPEAGIVEG